MNSRVENFLKERGLEDVVEKFEKEKVDIEVLQKMSTDNPCLLQFIPRLGDRILLLDFVKNLKNDKRQQSKKMKLLDRLKKKLNQTCADEDNASENSTESDSDSKCKNKVKKGKFNHLKGNKHAKKESRRIDLGWLMKEKTDPPRQIKENKGGGTRKLNVEKQTTKELIIEEGKSLFFPKGKCKFGNIDDFEFDVWDFAHCPMDANITIEDIYKETKVKILRLYLVSIRNSSDNSTDDSCELPALAKPKMEKSKTKTDILSQAIEISGITADAEQDSEVLFKSDLAIGFDIPDWLDETLPLAVPPNADKGDNTGNASLCTNTNEHDKSVSLETLPSLCQSLSGDDSGSLANTFPMPLCCYIGNQFGAGEDMLSDTSSTSKGETLIKIHEGNVLKELIGHFKDPCIINEKIAVKKYIASSNVPENGEGSGVLRDVFTEFYSDFYQECTNGSTFKVPILRHDFQDEEWKAVGRIILKGYRDLGYFPVCICPTVIEECLYGKILSNVLDCFFYYIPQSEVKCLKNAIQNFQNVDLDELIDIVDSHQCHVTPTKENIQLLLIEIATKELVQETRFVVDMWKDVMKPLSQIILPDKLQTIYQSLVPDTRKVLKLLKFPDVITPGQANTMKFLKMYIRELDFELLKLFLRYCTGSDLLTKDVLEIYVDFVYMEENVRRPIAHTCGCTLKLADNFRNFPQFRTEFNGVLKSGIWIMDIM